MAEEYCAPCVQLQEESSDFYENGVTESVCNSLGQNTGFNPESGNNDCEDLKLANDCLILGNIEELPGYDVCDWKEFMEQYLPNQYNMNEAIICAICGLWGELKNIRLNNLGIDVQYTVTQSRPGYSISIDRSGNFTYFFTDWITEEPENKYGEATLKGKADWCFSIDNDNNVNWKINSVTITTFQFTLINSEGAITKPTHTVRVPDENGTIVYQVTPTSNLNVAINKTVEVNKTGTVASGQNSGWINFCNVYGDWVLDSDIDLQVKFNNGNVDSVPIC